MKSSTVLRLYKLFMAIALMITAILIFIGEEFRVGNLPPVNFTIGIICISAGVSDIVAALIDRKTIYDISYFFTNTALSWWVFTQAAYAFYGIASWGRVVVFGLVLVENTIVVPYMLSERSAESAIDHAQSTVEQIQRDREKRQNGTP